MDDIAGKARAASKRTMATGCPTLRRVTTVSGKASKRQIAGVDDEQPLQK